MKGTAARSAPQPNDTHSTGARSDEVPAKAITVRQNRGHWASALRTVEAHKFNLMRKLDIHNKAQLVTVAILKKDRQPPVPM